MKKTKGYFYCSIIARAFLNYNKYNPQNETFRHSRTSRLFS